MMRRVDIVKKWICNKIDMDQVYTDECKFTLDDNYSSSTWEKNITNRRRKKPFRGGSVMIWVCISNSGLVPLRKLEGTLSTVKYY